MSRDRITPSEERDEVVESHTTTLSPCFSAASTSPTVATFVVRSVVISLRVAMSKIVASGPTRVVMLSWSSGATASFGYM